MQSVLVKCEVCVCVCQRGLDLQAAVSLQCVSVDGWAHCGQRFVGLGATQLMGQLAQPQNPSGLITAPVQTPSSFSFLPSFFPSLTLNPPFLSSLPPVHAANPVWHVTAPLPSLEHTSHPQRKRPSQLAALTLIDLAPVLTQTPGETFSEREAWMGVGVQPSRRHGGGRG